MNLPIAHSRESDSEIQSLSEHLLNVARNTSKLAGKIGLSDCGYLIGLLHDVGKYTEEFQEYIEKAIAENKDPDSDDTKSKKGKIDHSSAGAQIIWQDLSKKGGTYIPLAQCLSLCVASHHSGLIDCFNHHEKVNFLERMNKDVNLNEVRSKLELDNSIFEKYREILTNNKIISEFENSVYSIKESNDDSGVKSCTCLHLKLGLLVRYLFSCLIDGDRSDTIDFVEPETKSKRSNYNYKPWSELITKFEDYLKQKKIDLEIDNIRKDVADHCYQSSNKDQGIFSLTVPTGGGKTLSSFRFALHHAEKHQLDRIIFALPFTTIIEQNAAVIRDILEDSDEQIVIEHHCNLIPEVDNWFNSVLSQNWDSRVVFTTNVQILESLFGSGTTSVRRMHQLARSIIIFDEAQAIPIKCIHLINNAINLLVDNFKSTVVLCTATQPLLNNVDPTKGSLNRVKEIIPNPQELFNKLKRVKVRYEKDDLSYVQIIELIKEQYDNKKTCLVVVNTKTNAREIFKLCKQQDFNFVYHLSTAMCPAHRKEKLSIIQSNLKARNPVICISTQLIEAGVDIDFDTVIRATAGLDSIAQAAGRCNRNGKLDFGELIVINVAEENLSRLPDLREAKEIGKRVIRFFNKNPDKYENDLLGNEAISKFFKDYFEKNNIKEKMAYKADSKNVSILNNIAYTTLLELLSTNWAFSENSEFNKIPFRQSFKTANNHFEPIDNQTTSILVQFDQKSEELINNLCSNKLKDKSNRKLIKLTQQYSVNIFNQELKELINNNAISKINDKLEIIYLNKNFYDQDFGISVKKLSNMESLCV
jgi:CRISPR-associated endonuclease/helicase Cas3